MPTSDEVTFLLLSSPALVNLNFNGLDRVDDQVFERVALHHGFPHLEEFRIYMCDFLTERTIDLLLTLSSPLRELDLEYCKLLTEAHYEGWQKKVIDNNWNLSINWSSPDN